MSLHKDNLARETKPAPNENSGTMTSHRQRIDAIDRRIAELLNQRAAVALEVARTKQGQGLKVFSPQREEQVIRSLQKANRGPLPSPALARIYSEIISACRGLQGELRVAYLGPEFTFSHQAALGRFGSSAHLIPQAGIAEIFEEVKRGKSQAGLVPVENSSQGAVGLSLDLFMENGLKVCGEILWPVRHALMSRCPDLGGIQKVYSHPQALAQCRRWLARNLPRAALQETASTTAACQQAAAEEGAAAVGGEAAASRYGLEILASRIQDTDHNATRFFVLGQEDCPPTGDDKTSLVFITAHRPGSLFGALQHLSEQGLNLTRIESRPTRHRPWEYAFFVDLMGHRQDQAVQKALDELEKETTWLNILGSYPRAEHPWGSGETAG